MKKMLRKSFALVLAIVCVLNIASVIASAAAPSSGDLGKNLKWSVSSKGVLTIKGKGEMTDFGVADARPWDDHRDEIVKVVVEDGVTSVSEKAFSHLGELKEVELPKSLIFVGCDIFYGSLYDGQVKADKYGVRYEDGVILNSTTEIKGTYEIAKDTRVIADYAFNGQSELKQVKMPEGLITIGVEAFKDCRSIESVTIPESVTSIGYQAFANCENLNEVCYAGTLAQWNKIKIHVSNDEWLREVKIYCKGDINRDGKTNSSDALMALQHSVGTIELKSEQIALADVCTDSKINSSDALEILKISVGSTK